MSKVSKETKEKLHSKSKTVSQRKVSSSSKKLRMGIENDKENQASPFSPRYQTAYLYYSDPMSDTYGNAKKSALKAGFPLTMANNITSRVWWKHQERIVMGMLPSAEVNLRNILDMDCENSVVTKDGEVLTIKDSKLLKIQADTSMFIAKTVGDYNEKKELNLTHKFEEFESDDVIDNLFGTEFKYIDDED